MPSRSRVMRYVWSVRARITVMATLIVALATVTAAATMLSVQRTELTDNVDRALRLRADDLAAVLVDGDLPATLGQADREIAAVQVIDADGHVISSTANVAGEPPLVSDRPAPGASRLSRVDALSIDDEPFRVLARTVVAPGETFTLVVASSLEPVAESTESLTSILVTGGPLLLAFVAAGTWVVVGRALAPVEAMRREVAAITAADLGRRVPRPGVDDEIGRLARTLNGMLERLQQAAERERRFVADASHELRSPLASLRAQLEVPATPGEPGRAADLLAEVLRMQALVDDLLLLARGASGVGADRRLLDVDDIVLEEVRRLRGGPAAIDAGGILAGQVEGDPGQLARVVRNLLENATRHARARVAVSLAEEGGAVVLRVEDDGPGVPAGDRERIFERFARVDAARARGDGGGAGLGLAIARSLVEAHGGDITVGDAPLGGALFTVRLPAAKGGHVDRPRPSATS